MARKAELHVHLEGSIAPETLIEIDPSLTLDEIAGATRFTDFEGFLQSYIWVNRRLQSPEHYAIAARALFETLASQDVIYAEVTLSAGVILWKQQDFASIYEALQREAARARIQVRWILDAVRQFGADAARPVFDLAAERVNDGVVAIGLGGSEAQGPAEWFSELFARARDRGLHLTCHAGETSGSESVWGALAIGAERIGHGIRAIDDPKLVAHLAGRKIALEISITSNLRTGAIDSLACHPVRKLHDAQVPIVLNTDDPALFGCTLNGEYDLAAHKFGFTPAELDALASLSLAYAFDQVGTVER